MSRRFVRKLFAPLVSSLWTHPAILLRIGGKDRRGLNTEIAFLDEKGALRARFGLEASQLAGKRPLAYSPFTELIGSDRKVRIRQGLDVSEYPVLAMGDSKSENRVLFGHLDSRDVAGAKAPDPWDRWALVLRDPSHGWRDYVDIGMTTPLGTEQRTGYAVLRNSANRELSMLPKQ
jgi:hypothetical protein